MSKRGICEICNQHRYLSKGKRCKPCSYSLGICIKCERKVKIYVQGLCYLCYQDRQVLCKLDKIEKDFSTTADQYNNQLFELYLSYIKRYRLHYAHLRQAKRLSDILKDNKINTIKKWFDVYGLSDRYLVFHKPNKMQGCAFIKIGYMLTELGVIPPREDEVDLQIQHQLSHLSLDDHNKVELFLKSLLKINTAKNTVLHYLRSLRELQIWALRQKNINSLLYIDTFILAEFFNQRADKNYKNQRKMYLQIRRFYRWCLLQRYILQDPSPEINFSRAHEKLLICSEEQFDLIRKYIKNPRSDSEKALLLTLILFWGFTTIDLTQAQVILQDDLFHLKLRRKDLTKGKKYYNRKEMLVLPTNPKWFLALQQRFLKDWMAHYSKVKKSYPQTPLVLAKHNRYNRYLNTTTIRNRVYEATVEATDQKIPIRVLKQTCGHIYSSKSDASLLSTMGWSNQFSFHYTWLPRTYYQSNQV